MATKKIINPYTGKAYSIRQRSTKNGRKGQIVGLYHTKRQSSQHVVNNLGDVIKRLSFE